MSRQSLSRAPLLERCPRWTDVWCQSKLDVKKVSFVWKIDNFSLRPEKTGISIRSAVFSEKDESRIKWSLRLYPNGVKESDKDFVCLFMYLESSDRKEIWAKYKFAIIDDNDLQSYKFSSSAVFQVGKSWSDPEHHKFISKQRLGSRLLPEDTFTLLCEITYSISSETKSGRNSWYSCLLWFPKLLGIRTKVSYESGKQSIVDKISELFYDPKYSDVILDVSGHQFKAHKLILRIRSPVFAAMFEHPLQENQNNRVIITDVNKEVFKEMLRFIYSGDKYTLNVEMSAELLAAADKYDLVDLKTVCENSLISEINVDTVCELLLLADMHSAEELKSKAIQYINRHSNKVLKSDDWNKVVENPHILNQCFTAVVT